VDNLSPHGNDVSFKKGYTCLHAHDGRFPSTFLDQVHTTMSTPFPSAQEKMLSRDDIPSVIAPLRSTRRIVFTNGCFDILHAGHADLLARARQLGDFLIVGVNSSDSVRRLKGPTRPLNPTEQRMYVLASLACVDAVIPFDEDTPYELIQAVQPHVLVKGGDWAIENIVGRDIVEASGGSVHSLKLLPGYSTTGLIQKILRTCSAEAK